MGGFFGIASKTDCIMNLFFGVDYHSHLGTKKGGLAVFGEEGFKKSIHNIQNSPFRTKFDNDLEELHGNIGIGCISDNEAQPLFVNSPLGTFAITTVGIINNINELKDECFKNGKIQFLEMNRGLLNPTEMVATLINQKSNIIEGIKYAQDKIEGSMSILIMFPDKIYAARDKYGRTPIIIGKSKNAYCATFESFVFQNLGYKYVKDLGPGEIVSFTATELVQEKEPNKEMKICSFLWTYYGYATSTYEGVNVEEMRYRCGRLLKQKDTIEADAVTGVPDSGIAHAIGYSNEAHIPYIRPLIKYTPTWPRSFTPTNQAQRNLIAKMKLIAIPELIKGKKLVIIDDSIVRGTQLKETANYLYEEGVKEVHVRPACPPILFSCKYLNFTRSTSDMDLITRKVIAELEGVDVVSDELASQYVDPSSEKYQKMVDEIRKKMKFDTLMYHNVHDLVESIGIDSCKLCTYCFNGKK